MLTTTHPATLTPTSSLSLTDVLTIVAWHDDTVDNMPGSIPTACDDALIWWTPIAGTIALAMAHRFSAYAATGPTSWTVEDIARTFGIGQSVSRVVHTLDRLERFGIIRRDRRTIAVRLWLPKLNARQLAQLPDYLAFVYPH
jgi:hypothetical protein